ncbi:MAG: hypothetical protein ABJB47_04830 [Actinomycetota bacterium]
MNSASGPPAAAVNEYDLMAALFAPGPAEDSEVRRCLRPPADFLLRPGGPAADELGVVPQEGERQGDQLGPFLERPLAGRVLGGHQPADVLQLICPRDGLCQ